MRKLIFTFIGISLLLACNQRVEEDQPANGNDSINTTTADHEEGIETGYIVPQNDRMMKRYCFTLDLQDDPELIKEYKYWHENENIWPEIPEGIKKVGITNMEIYLHGTRMFMIMETVPEFDLEKDFERLGKLPRQAEWEKFVWKFQKSVPGAPEGTKWQLMERVYKLQ
jgi:L-rhamnose mutarotase